MKDQAIRDRVTGRDEAMSLIGLSEIDKRSKDVQQGFWRHMYQTGKDYLGIKDPEPDKRPSFDRQEALAFERRLVGFGKHYNETYSDAPIDYLIWLSEQNENLNKYLRSEIGQRRQG